MRWHLLAPPHIERPPQHALYTAQPHLTRANYMGVRARAAARMHDLVEGQLQTIDVAVYALITLAFWLYHH